MAPRAPELHKYDISPKVCDPYRQSQPLAVPGEGSRRTWHFLSVRSPYGIGKPVEHTAIFQCLLQFRLFDGCKRTDMDSDIAARNRGIEMSDSRKVDEPTQQPGTNPRAEPF